MKNGSLSVTGATGFVGWNLTDMFLRHEWDVRAIVRPGNTKSLPVRAKVIEAALEPGALAKAFAGSDVVVHCAALIRAQSEEVFNAVNIEGTRAAAEAARRVGARFIQISSQAAGGPGTTAHPRSERDADAPVNAYGRSKLWAETAVRTTPRLQWTILRPSAVYGPRDRGFLPLYRMANRGFLWSPARPETPYTFIHVGDLVEAVRLAVLSPASIGETLYIGHDSPRTAYQVMRVLGSASGRRARPHQVPGFIMSAAAAMGDRAWKKGKMPLVDSGRLAEFNAPGFVCSVERARKVLGFEADVALEDGIARTARWYRDQGWL
jgi:nucleoside-diphosphate-sugar epimerase